jgi:RHS repeat-associated protein
VFVESQFDTFGRPWKTSYPYRTGDVKLWTENFYDTAGRPFKVRTPDGAEVETFYSLATTGSQIGTVVTVTDQALKQRRSITNALGQLKRVDEPTDAGGLGAVSSPNQPTNYTYDVLNNLLTVVQASNTTQQCGGAPNCSQTRTFVYDSLSRLKSATNPESGTISYGYDSNGNLTSKTDARLVVTNYIYDALNRVTQRNYTAPNGLANYQATPNVSYFYDNLPNAKGKLTKVTNGTGANTSTTEYVTFDILGRVIRSKQTTDGVVYGTDAAPMTYTYNLSGAMIEQKYPSGRVVKNVLDNDGDLSIVQSKKNANSGFFNYAKNFTYNAAGAATSLQLGNNRWESTQFNSRLQPTQIALGTVQNGTDKLKLDYSYGTTQNSGNVQSQTITVPTVGSNPGFTATQTYTYDSLNRIKDAKEMISTTQTWMQTFLYDRYGNRNFDTTLNRTTTIPAGCAVAVCNPSVNPATNKLVGYVFDNVGNTTKDAQLRKFTYDGENKQVKVETTNSGGTVIATNGEYVYDGDGKRVKKKGYTNNVLTEETIFVYDAAGKLVAEYSTNVAPASTAQVSYLTNDHLGSPRINTDANGAVISRHDYHPFGEEVFTTQRTTALGYAADTVRKKFTGYERDGETQLDFAQARYFASSFGRFSSPDIPLMDQDSGDPQSWNLYIYAGNSPLKYTDPLGLWKQVDCEGGSTNCWEMEEGDTLESLAEKLGLSSDNINDFFFGQELVEGRVFDMSGYADWLKQQPDAMKRTAHDIAAGMPQFEPGGGGIRVVGKLGKSSGFFGWVGRQAGRFGRWTGLISPTTAATVGQMAAKQLVGSSGKEMIRDAVNIVKSFKGSPQQKAELLEAFAKQIGQRTGGSWSAVRSAGADGSAIFHGDLGHSIVIKSTGEIFVGTLKDGFSFGKGGVLTPLYEVLKKID